MVRNANAILLMLAVAPVVYLVLAALVTFGKGGFARDQNIIPVLFFAFVVVSLVNIGIIVFVQTSKSIMSERGRYDPVGRTYLIMSTGAVLAEAYTIYGLVELTQGKSDGFTPVSSVPEKPVSNGVRAG